MQHSVAVTEAEAFTKRNWIGRLRYYSYIQRAPKLLWDEKLTLKFESLAPYRVL